MKIIVSSSQKQSMWKYVFAFLVSLRWILWVLILYDYALYASADNEVKGWTLVEWVLDDIVYIPYQHSVVLDRFAQQTLFPWCSDYVYSGDVLRLIDDMCHVTTEDYQKFRVTLGTGVVWSDGEVVDYDDLFFTYSTIIKNNQRSLPFLDTHANIEVTKEADALYVEFDYDSIDHRLFFLSPLLPEHIVQDMSYQEYLYTYSRDPVVAWCGRVKQDVIDTASFILDMKECPGGLSFYQIKRFGDSDHARVALSDPETIVGITDIDLAFDEGFTPFDVRTYEYPTLFFNTTSDRLTPNVMKYLVSFIHNNMRTPSSIRQDQLYLNYTPATGQDIRELLLSVNPDLDVDRVTLENAQVEVLPDVITIEWTKHRKSYMLESLEDFVTVRLEIEEDIDALSFALNDTSSRLTKSSWTYSFGLKRDMLTVWLNKIRLTAKQDGEEIDLAIFDIYYIEAPKDPLLEEKQLKILYFNDESSADIVRALQSLFLQYDIAAFFRFVPYDNVQDFQDKILSRDYDMVLRPLSLGLKQDISNLFLTDDVLVNPSQYVNVDLAQAISRYTQGKPEAKETIDRIYAAFAPLYIIGERLDVMYTLYDAPDNMHDIYTAKQHFADTLRLTTYLRLDTQRVMSGTIAWEYVDNLLHEMGWK